MDKEYIIAVIGVGGTLLGFLLAEISGFLKRTHEEKERFLLGNFNLRQNAYAEIYTALTKYEKYFYKFIDYGNEFLEHEDPENFAPLESMEKLIEIYEANEVWLHVETVKAFKLLFDNSAGLLNLAIFCASGDAEYGSSEVEQASKGILNRISSLKEHISKITGMIELDKHSNKMLTEILEKKWMKILKK